MPEIGLTVRAISVRTRHRMNDSVFFFLSLLRRINKEKKKSQTSRTTASLTGGDLGDQEPSKPRALSQRPECDYHDGQLRTVKPTRNRRT